MVSIHHHSKASNSIYYYNIYYHCHYNIYFDSLRSTNQPSTPPTIKMPSNVFSTMAARAKAHHEAVNAAYTTYYGRATVAGPVSPTSSRSSSIAAPSSESPKSPTNASKAWSAIKKHHREMNEAYSVYYSPGVSAAPSRANSASSTPRHSAEAARKEPQSQQPCNIAKAWQAIKTKAVEHHRSVNAAAQQTYGIH